MRWFTKHEAPEVPEAEFAHSPGLEPILLGRQAQEALKNPSIQIALDKIEAEIVNAWKTSAPKDDVAREHLYYRLEGLAAFKAKLQGFVNNMKVEVKKTGPNPKG